MCMALGGRAAEEIVFNSMTTGAQDDLERVTKIAYDQVSIYGMSDKVGNLSFQNDGSPLKPYSDELSNFMDIEARDFNSCPKMFEFDWGCTLKNINAISSRS